MADQFPPEKKRRRLSSEERRAEIIRNAVQYFASEGFDISTRDLADKLGITQPLLYRYFKSKDELISEVYQSVYLKRWGDDWDWIILDRTSPLKERIRQFYLAYSGVAFDRDWVRIFLFAGLKGMELNRDYLSRVETRLLVPMITEFRAERGLDPRAPTQEEIDIAWIMHGAIYYHGMREVVYFGTHPERIEFVASQAIDGFLSQLAGITGD